MENSEKKCCGGNCNIEKNVGKIDRNARIAIGSALLGATSLSKSNWGKLAILGGGIAMLATGVTGKCWMYKLLGVNTNDEEAGETPAEPLA